MTNQADRTITSYSVSKRGFPPVHKSPSINVNYGCCSSPVVYLMRPKWVSDELWETFLDGIILNIPAGTKA